MLVKDKMWKVQQPGTILRARHSARRGQLALVLARAKSGPRPSNGYPATEYVKMQMISTGERIEESLTNANNCWDIVSEP
jgi:hypothetical protein